MHLTATLRRQVGERVVRFNAPIAFKQVTMFYRQVAPEDQFLEITGVPYLISQSSEGHSIGKSNDLEKDTI